MVVYCVQLDFDTIGAHGGGVRVESGMNPKSSCCVNIVPLTDQFNHCFWCFAFRKSLTGHRLHATLG